MSNGHATTGRQWDVGAWSNPVTGVLVLYIVGIILYVAGVPWALVILIGLLAGAALTWSVHQAGFRRLGVAYTAACAAVATAWSSYASTVLTFDVFAPEATGVHLLTLAGACLPLAIVWVVLLVGQSRTYQAKYVASQSVERRRSATDAAVRAAGIKGWAMTAEGANADRLAAEFEIAPGGTTFRQALTLLEPLEIALRAPFRGAVRLEQPKGGHVGQVRLTCSRRSILADVLPMPPVPTGPRSILDRLAVGRFEDGERAAEVYAYQTTSSIGQRDAGKSGLQNVMIDNYASCLDCLIWTVDFKEGSVARHWLEPFAKGHIPTPVFDWVGFTAADVLAMVAELDRIASTRARGRRGDKIKPSPDLPAIRLMIDEVADLLADSGMDPLKRKAVELLIKVVRKHRSEGLDVDVFSQRATMSFLGPHARDLLSQTTHKNILRVDSPTEVFNTLSIANSQLGGVDPSEFTEPGSLMTVRPGSRKAARRTYYLPTEDIPARAAHYAAFRPSLEPTAAQGASRAYHERWTNPRMTAFLTAIRDGQAFALDTDTDTDTDETVAGTAPATAPAAAAPAVSGVEPTSHLRRLRAVLHDQFGTEAGEARYDLARGKVALRVMTNHIRATGADAAPTRDLLAALAAADTGFEGLAPRDLAALLAPYEVEPVQLGRAWEGNPRGYRLADTAAGLDREPATDDPARHDAATDDAPEPVLERSR
ncbi:DUF4133 domain-containing protein [Glycomyces paridis]|uniref:DUF4133 domain-containing protein n=1 Tax=Glycomyces paridis TaxID=2126555 RepID=A0A4S8PGI6_9ACTN|nr:DUF4133 domain-containing protein [Glycomyces paridis]THV29643.1 DUF4133 domain-containing protein [Glycomyces paridis]